MHIERLETSLVAALLILAISIGLLCVSASWVIVRDGLDTCDHVEVSP